MATNTTKRNKLIAALKRWEYWVGILSVVFTLALAALIIFKWETVQALEGYGYLGGFAISALGGATVIVPVPMLAVQFALGGILKPWFGPEFMAPVFIGLVFSLGETLGALTIYFTGYGGGMPSAHAEAGRIQRLNNTIFALSHNKPLLLSGSPGRWSTAPRRKKILPHLLCREDH